MLDANANITATQELPKAAQPTNKPVNPGQPANK